MASFLIDEVNELLKLKKGDSLRLNHIKKLCEKNDLIPISERKYVERLANQYLYAKKSSKPQSIVTQPVSPDNFKEEEEIKTKNTKTKSLQITDKYKTVQEKKKEHFELTSKTKILVSIAAIVLGIIIITIVSTNMDITILEETDLGQRSTNLSSPYLIIETDEMSYRKADIISVSGELNPAIDGNVRLTLKNPDSEVIWAENVQVKESGDFSTLIIAGGEGWESGEYTLNVFYENRENQISFEFIE